MNAPNPLVRKGEETAPTEGAGLFHDVTEAFTKINDEQWAEGLANAVGAVAGVAQFLVDPMAGLQRRVRLAHRARGLPARAAGLAGR